MQTIYNSIQNVDKEQRGEYLQSTMSAIKERMDKFEFRMARGIPLNPEQQRQYDSMKSAFNDIQKYLNNPTIYDRQFEQLEANRQRVADRGNTLNNTTSYTR
jgi:hypothetical protein